MHIGSTIRYHADNKKTIISPNAPQVKTLYSVGEPSVFIFSVDQVPKTVMWEESLGWFAPVLWYKGGKICLELCIILCSEDGMGG
jgi:hypothetical protein